jgi:hypothetical protein
MRRLSKRFEITFLSVNVYGRDWYALGIGREALELKPVDS